MMTDLYGKRELTPRQAEIVRLLARGLMNAEIARAIDTTDEGVRNHLRAIFDKVGVSNRVELALWYEARRAERGLVSPLFD